MSDNGAEGAAYEANAIGGNNLSNHIKKYYNNTYDNIGNFDSFVWYGPLWAQAATAPSRLYKAWTTEGKCSPSIRAVRDILINKPLSSGGVRVPCLFKYPGMRESEISNEFCTVMDLVPTILEMAGVRHPAPSYQGREVVPMRGTSMKSWFEVCICLSHLGLRLPRN